MTTTMQTWKHTSTNRPTIARTTNQPTKKKRERKKQTNKTVNKQSNLIIYIKFVLYKFYINV